MHCDSEIDIHLVKNLVFDDRMKQIELSTILEKIDIEENNVDMITNMARKHEFEWCKTYMGCLKM